MNAERRTRVGQPAWDVALLFPPQGEWTEAEYLALEGSAENRLIELVDGVIEVLPMPDPFHQRITRFMFRRLDDYAEETGSGEAFFAPLPVWLWANHLREPDLVFLRPRRIKSPRKPPRGADVVMEVVSPGKKNRERDLEIKREIYARARIREYWIIDPEERKILVLFLKGASYKTHGEFGPGDRAASKLLSGFEVDVDEVFAAGEKAS
jgi:Uma2 family endonuclease